MTKPLTDAELDRILRASTSSIFYSGVARLVAEIRRSRAAAGLAERWRAEAVSDDIAHSLTLSTCADELEAALDQPAEREVRE